ncbi:hypothetical protein CC2G_012912 [Coprinopsis cinerea AmutBmut pab1-1]|nr:hypothetical protein CC2G_012912 [Coprinopsis cinerea AmutBmut pab1-1]
MPSEWGRWTELRKVVSSSSGVKGGVRPAKEGVNVTMVELRDRALTTPESRTCSPWEHRSCCAGEDKFLQKCYVTYNLPSTWCLELCKAQEDAVNSIFLSSSQTTP